MKTRRDATRILGWAGLLPIAALLPLSFFPTPEWLDSLLIGYAVLILAFMCGSLWAQAVGDPEGRPAAMVASNLLVFAALPALILPLGWACFWLAALFAVHWAAEWYWVRGSQPGWYRGLRVGLSASVVGLLVVAGLLLARYG